MKRNFSGRTIWITGATSGIGKALAIELAKHGNRLILSARRKAELEKVAETCRSFGSDPYIFPFDLSQPSEVETAAGMVLSRFGWIDVLINNGGISQRSFVLETPVEIDRKVMETDFFSGVILTKAVLPAMVQNGYGHIIVISSVTGEFGFPLRSAYAAAKHALHGFYETLWAELHNKGIDVTIVCPGRVNTNVSLNAITSSGEPHGVMDHDISKGITPEACAKRILDASGRKKKIVYIAGKELFMVYFKRYLPWLFYKLVTKVKPS
jgi:short-subunit dehydrogenase